MLHHGNDIIKEPVIQHNWVEGKYEWANHLRCLVAVDVCTLCECKRDRLKYLINEEVVESVSTYNRSKMVFDSDNMPPCWGASNP